MCDLKTIMLTPNRKGADDGNLSKADLRWPEARNGFHREGTEKRERKRLARGDLIEKPTLSVTATFPLLYFHIKTLQAVHHSVVCQLYLGNNIQETLRSTVTSEHTVHSTHPKGRGPSVY